MQPMAMTTNPNAIPLLYPVFFSTKEEGIDITK
jgi:hypothetical protein